MKLIYLYVRNYGILKNLELNFDSKYRFHYNHKAGIIEDLSSEDREELADDFFKINKGNVESVCALVGNNGAGKTSIARVIGEILTPSNMHSEFISIYEKGKEQLLGRSNILRKIDSKEIKSFMSKLKSINISEFTNQNKNLSTYYQDLMQSRIKNYTQLDNIKDLYIEDNEKYFKDFLEDLCVLSEDERKDFTNIDIFKKINNLKTDLKPYNSNRKSDFVGSLESYNDFCIPKDVTCKHLYITQNYTPMHIDMPKKCADLSTSNLLQKDNEKYFNGKFRQSVDNVFSAHKNMEFKRNITFFCFAQSKKADKNFRTFFNNIIFPEQLEIKASLFDFEYLLQEDRLSNKLKNIIQNLEEIEKETSSTIGFKKNLFIRLLVSFWGNYIRGMSIAQNPELLEPLTQKILDVTKMQLDEVMKNQECSYENIILYMKKMDLSTAAKHNNEYTPIEDSSINNAILFFEFLLQKHVNGEINCTNLPNIFLDLTKHRKFITKLVDLHNKAKNNTDFMAYSWSPNISSGEFSQLNIYSRLFDYLITEQTNNIQIFFDEIEITLHPEIQRKLVHDIIIFLETFFPSKKFQLFFGTHSPILLSDIPIQNVCFLKKNNGIVECVDKDVNKRLENSFGANIHSLFVHSFFLSNGTIGEFASKKINNIVERIEKIKCSIENRKDEEKTYSLYKKCILQGCIDLENEHNYEQLRSDIDIIGDPVVKQMLVNYLNSVHPEPAEYQLERIKFDSKEEKIQYLEEELQRLK